MQLFTCGTVRLLEHLGHKSLDDVQISIQVDAKVALPRLGVGRAPGSDHRTAIALAYGSQVGIEYFPAKIRDMAAFLSDDLPTDHPLAGVQATPKADSIPAIWILASSEGSTTLAARFGLEPVDLAAPLSLATWQGANQALKSAALWAALPPAAGGARLGALDASASGFRGRLNGDDAERVTAVPTSTESEAGSAVGGATSAGGAALLGVSLYGAQ